MKRWVVRQNLTELFHQLLNEALEARSVDPSEDARAYLIRLLERFSRCERATFDEPLALDYLESIHENPVARATKLQGIGDRALFLCGLFLERLDRGPVGPEYYIEIGGTAYAEVGALRGTSRPSSLFTEMSRRFRDFVGVFAELGQTEIFASDQNLVRIYGRWLATGASADAERLARLGVVPQRPKSVLQ